MKRGSDKVLAMLKGGHQKFWGSFYMVAWSFSHIEGGGGAKMSILYKGVQQVLPYFDGGGGRKKASDLRFFHFVGPPPPP